MHSLQVLQGYIDLQYNLEELEDYALFCDEIYSVNVLIKDRLYKAVSATEIVEQLNHLSSQEKQQLRLVFKKQSTVFGGQLGCHPISSIHIELKPNSQTVRQNPYPVAFHRKQQFNNELSIMVYDGVLVKIVRSEWGFPRFVIPKKDMRVRWDSDFRKLNKMIFCKPFPIPKISDILMERQEYIHFTKIDLSMMFYGFKLDKESQKICFISTEHGCYAYTRLPMGVKISPDVSQQHMTEMLQGIPNMSCYIDDVGIWTRGVFSEHLDVVDVVLERFSKKK